MICSVFERDGCGFDARSTQFGWIVNTTLYAMSTGIVRKAETGTVCELNGALPVTVKLESVH